MLEQLLYLPLKLNKRIQTMALFIFNRNLRYHMIYRIS